MEAIVVASYNMSFMSDKEKQKSFASEFAFLSTNTDKADPRKYWKNAKDLLKKFIINQEQENKKTCVIGLQEMNYAAGTETGSGAIDTMLEEVNDELKTKYKQICKYITVEKKGGNEDLAVSIIYDTEKFGDIKEANATWDKEKKGDPNIWDNYDIEETKEKPKGRPTMLVVTKKNYVFITMHGAQNPKLGRNKTKFNENMIKENKDKGEEKITEHLLAFDLNETNLPSDIFLMGDLNDRYDAITHFIILGKKLFYVGKSPKSCCYNYDSSCTDERYMKEYDEKSDYFISTDKKIVEHRKDREIKLKGFVKELDYGTCLDDITKNEIKSAMPGEEGWTQNYRYKGDKVFGINPISKIKIFEGVTRNKMSVESDHQMVYATFNIKKLVVSEKEAPIEEALNEEALNEEAPPIEGALNEEAPIEGGGRKRRTRKRRGTKKVKKGGKRKTKKSGRKTRRKRIN